MINPNATKRVIVNVKPHINRNGYIDQYCSYEGKDYNIVLPKGKPIKPGKRYLYLCYSILNDGVYIRGNKY